MEAQEIVELLDSNTIHAQGTRFPARDFNGVSLLSGELRITLSEKDVVFFSPASYFNKLPTGYTEERLFFVLLDEPLKPLPSSTSIILFKHRLDWIESFEMLAREFRVLQRKKEQVLRLTNLVNQGSSLQHIANTAAQIIEAPASVLDTSLSFLAKSDDFPDWAVEGGKEARALPQRAYELLKEKNLIMPSRPRDLVSFDFIDAFGEPAINYFSFIHQRSSIIGSISFFAKGKPLRKSRIEMIPAISQIVGIQLQKSNTHLLNKSLYYTHLFRQMEEGMLLDTPDQLRTRFAFFGYPLKRFMHIMVIDLSQAYLPIEEVYILAKELHPMIPNSIYITSESELDFLLSSDEIHEESTIDQKRLGDALRERGLDAGISSIYLDPKRTPSYRAEAQRAIDVGRKVKPERHVYPFSRYRLLDLINSVMDGRRLYSYRYPPLVHVIDHDLAHDGNLTLTLYEYLQNPTEPEAVAEKLFIHKNTLYFRLGKIREIMGCDFKDAETITCIQMTFHVLRIQGRFNDLVRRKRPASDEQRRAAKRRIKEQDK